MTQSINNKNDASLAVGHMSGNLLTEIKQATETVLHKVTEAPIVPKAEKASKNEARVVCQVTVGEGAAASLG
jgi:hypothetical protein